MKATRRTRAVGLIGYPGLTALDLVGPMDVFATANELLAAAAQASAQPAYELIVIGLRKGPFRAESGLAFVPHAVLADAPVLDTVIVPGGSGLRKPAELRMVSRWLQIRQRAIRRIASVCTGVYALAEAGLLDGATATTHWRFADAFGAKYPGVTVDADAIFIKQGRFYTSAGITAGIDLALALVEEDHGPKLALAVARELVVYLKRSGGQSQFSERLHFQARGSDDLAELGSWIQEHLAEDLPVERLAARCRVSPRQLARRFKSGLGLSPAAYVEHLRIEEAAQRLLTGHASIEQVALSVGFRSANVFRRAFERRFGVAAAKFRAGFGGTTLGPSPGARG